MKYVVAFLALSFSVSLFATSVAHKPLEDIVRESDHVVVATIASVDMVDGRGRPVTDPDARTGPGLSNQIRLNLQVKEVLFTRSSRLPHTLQVPLWTAWHYQLGNIQELTGATAIFLLEGDRYDPAYPAGFQRPLDEREAIEDLLARP